MVLLQNFRRFSSIVGMCCGCRFSLSLYLSLTLKDTACRTLKSCNPITLQFSVLPLLTHYLILTNSIIPAPKMKIRKRLESIDFIVVFVKTGELSLTMANNLVLKFYNSTNLHRGVPNLWKANTLP